MSDPIASGFNPFRDEDGIRFDPAGCLNDLKGFQQAANEILVLYGSGKTDALADQLIAVIEAEAPLRRSVQYLPFANEWGEVLGWTCNTSAEPLQPALDKAFDEAVSILRDSFEPPKDLAAVVLLNINLVGHICQIGHLGALSREDVHTIRHAIHDLEECREDLRQVADFADAWISFLMDWDNAHLLYEGLARNAGLSPDHALIAPKFYEQVICQIEWAENQFAGINQQRSKYEDVLYGRAKPNSLSALNTQAASASIPAGWSVFSNGTLDTWQALSDKAQKEHQDLLSLITGSTRGKLNQKLRQLVRTADRRCKVLIERLLHLRSVQSVLRDKRRDKQENETVTEHSDDFSSVIWFGQTHEFNKTQAAAVALLWAEWEKGGLALSEKTIGEKIGSSSDRYRLCHTFRVKGGGMHTAWGIMIQPSGKGKFCLAAPNHQ